MAETYGFFDSTDGDERIYTSDDFNNIFESLFGDGFVGDANSLRSVRSGFRITVKPGCAFINGHWYRNDTDKTLTASAPSSGVRYDRVVIQLSHNRNIISLVLRQGTSTDPPALNDNAEFKELAVCSLLVTTSGIQSVNDERKFISLKGGQ